MSKQPEQMRPPILRGVGVTATERFLAKLGDRSFLNLWSYPNPFRDQSDHSGARQGKEICDLLVVCGRHVIIFSEKTIAWQADKPTELAWSRWYRGAVEASLKQIRGAERWLKEHPNRVFLDPACKQPLPIALPPYEDRIVHRVIVARGAAEACQKYFGRGRGCLHLKPAIKGEDHFVPSAKHSVESFCVGDVQPNGPYVHVLDEASLHIVMNELDTITDFANYLQKKETFIRAGRLKEAEGEENLLTHYAIRINDCGEHDFSHPSGGPWPPGEEIHIQQGEYDDLVDNPQFAMKKLADRDSYVWDRLIEVFTKPLLDGTSLVPDGQTFDLRKSEVGARQMAIASRFRRRSLGKAVLDAFEKGRNTDRFFRMMIDRSDKQGSETGFFILILNYCPWMEKWGYEFYRKNRAYLAEIYAKAMLTKFPLIKQVVGISMECPGRDRGGSEDLIYAEQRNWSVDERAELEQECERLSIFRPGMKETPVTEAEFPDVELMRVVLPMPDELGEFTNGPRPNRAQRRRAKAQARASRRK
jgi:hypothetical protein